MAYLDAVREYMAQYEDDVKQYFDGVSRQRGLSNSFYKTFVDEYVATMDYPISDQGAGRCSHRGPRDGPTLAT